MPLPQLLVGKVAAITGGLTGIGRVRIMNSPNMLRLLTIQAIALEYLRHGAKVSVNHLGDSNEDALLESMNKDANEITRPQEQGQEKKRFLTVAGDITQPDTGKEFIAKTVEAFGRLDVFVSNAGVCKFEEFLEYVFLLFPFPLRRLGNANTNCSVEPPLLGHTVNTNLSGAFFAAQAAGRQMALAQSPPGGSILGISSISALVGGGQQTHYTPTKAGVLSLMQSCAVALGKYGIRCNALLPGTIRTQLNDEDMSDPVKLGYMQGRIPLGRLGQPGDLAGPAVFLACEELSSYVVSLFLFSIFGFSLFFIMPALTNAVQTGAQILVDGGLFVNLQ